MEEILEVVRVTLCSRMLLVAGKRIPSPTSNEKK